MTLKELFTRIPYEKETLGDEAKLRKRNGRLSSHWDTLTLHAALLDE
jgi:hypothetical protein